MDRLISEQAVIESIEFYQLNPQHFNFVNLIDDIKEIPSAEPKTGHWEFFCQHWRKCSECGNPHKFAEDWDYCPNCGARMERSKT